MVDISALVGGLRVWHVAAALDGVTLWSDRFAARGNAGIVLADAKARAVEEKRLTKEQADNAEWQVS